MHEKTPYGEPRRDDLVSQIHDQYHASLEFYTRGLCKRFGFDSEVDDILQIFYIKVMQKSEIVQQGLEKRGYPYLCQMIKNTCLDLDRKKKSLGRLKEDVGYHIPKVVSIDDLCADIYTASFLEDLRKYLSGSDIEIMVFYIQGFSYEEIGNKLTMSTSTVGVRIHRAKKVLAKQLGRSFKS